MWPSLAVWFAACAVHALVSATESNNGTSSTTFYSLLPSLSLHHCANPRLHAASLETISFSFYGEGLTYDSKRDRLILGSLNFGTLYAVPTSTLPNKNIHYGQHDISQLIDSRPSSFNGSNFLGLRMDPVDDDLVWGCVSYGEYYTYGVARVNMTNNNVKFFDLSNLANSATGNKAVLNDLAFSPDGQYLFVTDTWGYQIIRMTVSSGNAEIWNNGTIFCSECLTTDQHFDGPNGIEYVSSKVGHTCQDQVAGGGIGDYLLIGLGGSSNRILKVNATTPFEIPVEVNVSENAGILSQMDGFAMAIGDYSTLYVAGNGVNSVFVMTSTDEWKSATLRSTLNANCPKYQPSALVHLPYINEIVIYCTNGFGAAPYPLNRIEDATGRVMSEEGIKLSFGGDGNSGLEYDSQMDRLLLSSMLTGEVFGLPNTLRSGVVLSKMSAYTYFSGGGSNNITSAGGLRIDPSDSCSLWVAIKSFPIGIANVNICTANEDDEPSTFVDLSAFANPETGSTPNALTFFNNDIYVADVLGGYIWKVSFRDEANYAVDIILRYDASVERPQALETVPNGLLISLEGTDMLDSLQLLNVEENLISQVTVSPTKVFSSGAALSFDKEQAVLYSSGNDSVLAMISCDEWATATIAVDFQVNCGTSGEASGSDASLTFAGDNLWVFCNNGRDLHRITEVSSKVYTEEACYYSDASYSGGEDDNFSNLVENTFFWLSSALFLLCCCCGSLLLYRERRKNNLEQKLLS